MTDTFVHSAAAMGTVVTIEVAGEPASREGPPCVDRAMAWFAEIEATCSRFLPDSELRQLCTQEGVPVECSPLLFETIRFALEVARETDGAFDPTVGAAMVSRGFAREFRSGRATSARREAEGATFRDVVLDLDRRTVTLQRPLLLDLGAVAKGLAIDMAVRELAPLRDFVVDAGGDLYVSGRRGDGSAWSVGIRHPREQGRLIDTLRASDTAVCTSGDYERIGEGETHHIIEPRTGSTATGAASVTVIAPTAMVADALATAAFILGPHEGLLLLERHGVQGLIVTTALESLTTARFQRETTADLNGPERVPAPTQAVPAHP